MNMFEGAARAAYFVCIPIYSSTLIESSFSFSLLGLT